MAFWCTYIHTLNMKEKQDGFIFQEKKFLAECYYFTTWVDNKFQMIPNVIKTKIYFIHLLLWKTKYIRTYICMYVWYEKKYIYPTIHLSIHLKFKHTSSFKFFWKLEGKKKWLLLVKISYCLHLNWPSHWVAHKSFRSAFLCVTFLVKSDEPSMVSSVA